MVVILPPPFEWKKEKEIKTPADFEFQQTIYIPPKTAQYQHVMSIGIQRFPDEGINRQQFAGIYWTYSFFNLEFIIEIIFSYFCFPHDFASLIFQCFFSGREEEKNIRKQADHDRWYTLLIWCFIIARSIVHSDALQCDAAWMVITFRLGKKNWRRTQEGPLYYDIDLRRAGERAGGFDC